MVPRAVGAVTVSVMVVFNTVDPYTFVAVTTMMYGVPQVAPWMDRTEPFKFVLLFGLEHAYESAPANMVARFTEYSVFERVGALMVITI